MVVKAEERRTTVAVGESVFNASGADGAVRAGDLGPGGQRLEAMDGAVGGLYGDQTAIRVGHGRMLCSSRLVALSWNNDVCFYRSTPWTVACLGRLGVYYSQIT
jgi:hypothetical protein